MKKRIKKRCDERLISLKDWLKDKCKQNYSYNELKNLQVLRLGFNELTSIPPEIGLLTNIQELRLGFNELTSIPPEIGLLTNLQKLILNDNKLTSLPSEIGQLTNLQELHLSDNELTSLPPEIGQFANLQVLRLDNNELAFIPPEIGQLTNLQALYLCFNKLMSIPPEIGKLQLKYYYFDTDMLKQYRLYLSQSKCMSIKFRYIETKYEVSCPVCHDDFEEEEIVKILRCKHYFCEECITEWFKVKNTCPVCMG